MNKLEKYALDAFLKDMERTAADAHTKADVENRKLLTDSSLSKEDYTATLAEFNYHKGRYFVASTVLETLQGMFTEDE